MNFRLPVLVAASLVWTAAIAGAGEPANPHVPLQKTIGRPMAQGPVPSLGVINAQGAELAEGKLKLSGVSGNVIVFADRPVRAAGHETTELFISRWGEGKDSFTSDPPNATVSVLGGEKDGVTDAVVVLKNPKLADGTLTFDVDVLEGSLKGVKGPAAVFIDHFGGGGGGGWHGGYYGGDGWHGGYYGGYGWRHDYYGWGGHYGWYGAGVAAGAVAGATAWDLAVDAAGQPCGQLPYPPCP
jgi:hypothetical protein